MERMERMDRAGGGGGGAGPSIVITNTNTNTNENKNTNTNTNNNNNSGAVASEGFWGNLDARWFAGDFCTCMPCFPMFPFSCEKIIPHGRDAYQSKGWTVMMIGYVPIPLCWDNHMVRNYGTDTFKVTTPGCDQGTTHNWTSENEFQASDSCCPTTKGNKTSYAQAAAQHNSR